MSGHFDEHSQCHQNYFCPTFVGAPYRSFLTFPIVVRILVVAGTVAAVLDVCREALASTDGRPAVFIAYMTKNITIFSGRAFD